MYNQCRGLEIRLWDFSIADYQVGCMCPFHFGSSTISEKIMEKGCRSSHGKYRGFPPYNRERRYLSAFIRLSLEKLVCGHGGWRTYWGGEWCTQIDKANLSCGQTKIWEALVDISSSFQMMMRPWSLSYTVFSKNFQQKRNLDTNCAFALWKFLGFL